eukprot:SAG31_NODE_3198_length_4565_cov_4.748097_3_plen_191_part_00
MLLFFDPLHKQTGKETVVAHEADGSQYGPAIFRIHYDGWAYAPHINHVRLGDQLSNFVVSRYEHQFAGLVCFQNAEAKAQYGEKAPGATIHRCFATEAVQKQLASAGTGLNTSVIKGARDTTGDQQTPFAAWAASQGIPSCRLEVEPGDFYLFNSGLIHAVPEVLGSEPRIVLATFIGFSADDEEVMVWG